MPDQKVTPRFYVLVRTDMESMNPGRVAAQVSHATSMLHEDDAKSPLFNAWRKEAGGFGTTIVLDGGTESDIRGAFTLFSNQESTRKYWVCDPKYPIQDGEVVHVIPNVLTCVAILVDADADSEVNDYLQSLMLYSG